MTAKKQQKAKTHKPTKVLLVKAFGHTYRVAHIPYFAAVALEGHGYYAYTGAALLGLSIIALFVEVGNE